MDNTAEVCCYPSQYKWIIDDVILKEGIRDFTIDPTFASGKGENYLGVLYGLDVKGVKENGEMKGLKLILKIPLDSAIMRQKAPIHKMYAREAYAYNTLLPKLCALQEKYLVPEAERFRYIKCYKADSEEFQEYIILDDMRAKDFKMANRRQSLSVNHLKLALKTLASFHALSFVFKKSNPEEFEEIGGKIGDLSDFNEGFTNYMEAMKSRALAIIEDPVSAEKIKDFEVSSTKLKEYLDPKGISPYSVFCHGDWWNNNMLFKFEEEEPVDVILLDWQLPKNCSPVIDIAYLMFTSTDYDLRKNHFQELMDHYHESLTRSLNLMDCDIEEHFPKPVFEEHLKKFLPYGLFMSFMLLPAVLGEAEDVPDMDELFSKDVHDVKDMKFENKQASGRYDVRMNGVVRTFAEMNLI